MLQAPSRLSRVCGQSHIKKFWLTQMQNESQNCENKIGLVPSCSRPVCGSSVEGPESKERNSAGFCAKSFLTGVSPSLRHARPVVSGAITANGGHGAASTVVRNVSLATCAESLSPLRCSDQIYRLCQSSSPDLTNCNVEVENNGLDAAEELDCSSFKVPYVGDISASSSRCGSPSGDPESRHADHDVAENVVEAQFAKISNIKLPVGSQPATGGRDPLSSWGTCRAIGEGTVYVNQEERVELFKCVDNDSSENHSVELENSDSGTDAGDSDIAGSPVRGSRRGVLDTSGTSTSRRAGSIGWTLSAASQKRESERRIWISGACTEEFSVNHRESSPENENITHHSTLRVCTLCGTTKTPLWRSGPLGPKSLCNACGIRFKKSRRCAGHSEGSELLASPLGSSFRPSYRPLKRKQDTFRPCEAYLSRETGADTVVMEASFQHQKRSRWPDLTVKKEAAGHIGETAGSSPESCLTWNLLPSSSRSASVRKLDLLARSRIDLEKLRTVNEDGTKNQAISNEEEEAALLLMYLSYGFVYA